MAVKIQQLTQDIVVNGKGLFVRHWGGRSYFELTKEQIKRLRKELKQLEKKAA